MRDVRRDHIKRARMVANGGRENASGTGHLRQRELAGSCQAMTNLLPVDQILAVENGNAWKILKATGDQIVVLSNPTDTGIRIEAWKHRIRIGYRFFHREDTLPFIRSVQEADCRSLRA